VQRLHNTTNCITSLVTNTWPQIANKTQAQALIGNFCSNLWDGLTLVFRRKIKFFSFAKKNLTCTEFVHLNFNFRRHAHQRAKPLETRRQHAISISTSRTDCPQSGVKKRIASTLHWVKFQM
jgi:hypothetical protein